MKNNKVTKGIVAALMLASPMLAFAVQDQASFQPTIIYQDAELIAKHSEQAAAAAAQTAKQEAVSTKPEMSVANKKEESSMESNYLVGVIVLALAGFVLWSNKGQSSQGSGAPAAPASAAGDTGEAQGETGVARYLKRLEGAAASTVAVAAAVASVASETGVAKYLKTIETSAKETVAQTGVARYLANRDKT